MNNTVIKVPGVWKCSGCWEAEGWCKGIRAGPSSFQQTDKHVKGPSPILNANRKWGGHSRTIKEDKLSLVCLSVKLPSHCQMGKRKMFQLEEELPKPQIKMYVLTPCYLRVGNSQVKQWIPGVQLSKKRELHLSHLWRRASPVQVVTHLSAARVSANKVKMYVQLQKSYLRGR